MKFVLLAFLALLSFTFCYPQHNTNLEIEKKSHLFNSSKKNHTSSFKFYICNDTMVSESFDLTGTFQQSIQIRDRLYIYNSQEDYYFGFDLEEFPHSSLLDCKVAISENLNYDYIIRSSEYKKYETFIKVDTSINIPLHWSKFGKSFSNIFTEYGAIKELLRLPDSSHVMYHYKLSTESCKEKIFGDPDFEKIKMVEMPGMKPSIKSNIDPNLKIPNIALTNNEGVKVSLRDFIKNSQQEYILIDFWASWCKPCIEEFKYLTDLYNQVSDRGVRFIGINIDRRNDLKKALKIIGTYNLSWDQLYDFEFSNEKWEDITLNGIPRFLVINKKGKIINYDSPRPSSDKLKMLLNDLVKK